jgi:hypothetical protein
VEGSQQDAKVRDEGAEGSVFRALLKGRAGKLKSIDYFVELKR